MILIMEDWINGEEEAYGRRDRLKAATCRCADRKGLAGCWLRRRHRYKADQQPLCQRDKYALLDGDMTQAAEATIRCLPCAVSLRQVETVCAGSQQQSSIRERSIVEAVRPGSPALPGSNSDNFACCASFNSYRFVAIICSVQTTNPMN